MYLGDWQKITSESRIIAFLEPFCTGCRLEYRKIKLIDSLAILRVMPYSNFVLSGLVKQFNLDVQDGVWIQDVPAHQPSELLKIWLEQNVAFAVAQSTEKARSEFMIAPILAEVRQHFAGQISLFSGVEFNVDEASGLGGICDFLFSRSKQNLYVEAPVLSVVEATPARQVHLQGQDAKNESFKQGIAQVGAEMVAAELFNQREGQSYQQIFGVVTIGDEWKFLKLEQRVLYVDSKRYGLDELPQILGILIWMLEQQ